MKKLIGLIVIAGIAGASQAVTLAGWTFETSVPATAGPHAAEVGSGQALGFHAGASVYSNPAGNGSIESFSSNTWAVGDYWQFSTSTLGMFDVVFQFDGTSSNTGPRDFQIQWSTDGTTFNNFGGTVALLANAAPNPVWNSTTSSPLYTVIVDTSGVSALDNQATVWYRITNNSTVSANGGTVAATGTSRVDNVMISATPVPEPATMAALGLGVAALVRRRRK